MYERRGRRILSRQEFFWRILRQVSYTLLAMALSLVAGMAGYRMFEGLPWIDCFLNTAMLLGGMGEIDPLKTSGGKIFAGVYAIYCALFMLVSGGLLLAPVFHRILHHFHAEGAE